MFDEFAKSTAGLNVAEATARAVDLLPGFYFSAEAARNSSGYYAYRGSIEASVERSLLASDLVDVLWPNASSYEAKDVETYARSVHAAVPDKWLGYNITGAFPPDGSSLVEIERGVG